MSSTHDAIGRRPRDLAVSTGKPVVLTARDLDWFEMLHRHGALPAIYLHEFTKASCRNPKRSQDRATELFHEDNTHYGGTYLSRPFQQFATIDARYQNLVYDLTDRSVEALKDAGRWHERAPQTSSRHWRHDFMLSCITASIHLATLGTGYRFIFQDEILDRAETGLAFDVPYRFNGKRVEHQLKPDRIFGIQYPNKKVRLFIVEADCSTEVVRSTFARKTLERSFTQYKEFIGKGLYKDALKVQGGVLVIMMTTSTGRMENMMELVGGANSSFLFGYLPQFSRFFKPPKVMPHLFTDPWPRAGMEPVLIPQE